MKQQKKFVRNKAFTKLALDGMGMFQVDQKRKRLISFVRSGCCYHYDAEFEVVPNNRLVKVYERIEDFKDDHETITENKFYDGKWHKKVTHQAVKPDVQTN